MHSPVKIVRVIFLNIFSAEQALKEFDLSYDEIDSGLVGDGGDGGIDALYLLVNGQLVKEEWDFSELKRNIAVEPCRGSGENTQWVSRNPDRTLYQRQR